MIIKDRFDGTIKPEEYDTASEIMEGGFVPLQKERRTTAPWYFSYISTN
jgi:hypothetical protein